MVDLVATRGVWSLTDRLVNQTKKGWGCFTVEIQYIANSMCYFKVPLESYNLPWHKTSLLQSCCSGTCLLDETLSLVPTAAAVETNKLNLNHFCMVILVLSLLIL